MKTYDIVGSCPFVVGSNLYCAYFTILGTNYFDLYHFIDALVYDLKRRFYWFLFCIVGKFI